MTTSPGGVAAARAKLQRDLLRRYHERGDVEARQRLAAEMMPLARALAGRYAGRGEPQEDLVQVACLAMLKAIDGFDVSRNVGFSSYAVPTVLGELRRYFRDHTWAVRVPRGLQELQLQIAKARDGLTNDLGRSPTVPELADRLGVAVEEVVEAIESTGARRGRSLQEPIGDDLALADVLGVVDVEFNRAELRAVLDDAMTVLPARERAILRMRFEEDLTQTEIAARIGVSQMQISRLIRHSLARMRTEIERSPPAADRAAA